MAPAMFKALALLLLLHFPSQAAELVSRDGTQSIRVELDEKAKSALEEANAKGIDLTDSSFNQYSMTFYFCEKSQCQKMGAPLSIQAFFERIRDIEFKRRRTNDPAVASMLLSSQLLSYVIYKNYVGPAPALALSVAALGGTLFWWTYNRSLEREIARKLLMESEPVPAGRFSAFERIRDLIQQALNP